jgi:hypothetical protein
MSALLIRSGYLGPADGAARIAASPIGRMEDADVRGKASRHDRLNRLSEPSQAGYDPISRRCIGSGNQRLH